MFVEKFIVMIVSHVFKNKAFKYMAFKYMALVARRLRFCPPKKSIADGPTDGRTEGQTHPLIESWFMTKKLFAGSSLPAKQYY